MSQNVHAQFLFNLASFAKFFVVTLVAGVIRINHNFVLSKNGFAFAHSILRNDDKSGDVDGTYQ
jgi:hypothetical protein